VLAEWTETTPTALLVARHVAFMASLASTPSALGGNLEEAKIKADLFFDEET